MFAAWSLEHIGRLQAGDAAAWSAMVRRYHPWLASLVRRKTPADVLKRAHVDDFVQEMLVAICRGLPHAHFASRVAFEAWLMRVARRRLVDAVRRALSSKRNVRLHDAGSGPSLIEQMPGRTSSPSRDLQRREAAGAVQAILKRLPDRYRIVLELIHIERMPTPEVARVLGISQAAVRKRLERGLSLCRHVVCSEPALD